jgi:hypothetical protein
MDTIFQQLVDIIQLQQQKIDTIAQTLKKIESIGGGDATIEDYQSGKIYKRNTLVVDVNTETVYRVIPTEYLSVTVDDDKAAGNLKLVGYESGFIAFAHDPSQAEINNLPDGTLVAVYSSTDPPYQPPN